MGSKIKTRLVNFIFNIAMVLTGIFVHRDPGTILIGGWMGTKFADNPRYLYQYLFEHKQELGLHEVIWVTRNPQVQTMLKDMGYTVCLCGTPESRHWHKKAGVHVICNNYTEGGPLEPDIETRYSFRAVRFQLWHGVGMKSVGEAANELSGVSGVMDRLEHISWLNTLTSTGGWARSWFLSTSPINADVNVKISGCEPECTYLSVYPRNCPCVRFTDREQEVMEIIRRHKGALLYVPTFRSDYSHYIHPLQDREFCQYLKKTGLLWIEKPHTESHFSLEGMEQGLNVLMLEKEFDINVMISEMTAVISDYSSAVFDGIYKEVPVIMYAPDLEEFKQGNVGFLFDVDTYLGPIIEKDLTGTARVIDEICGGTYRTSERKRVFASVRKDFFDDRSSSYEEVWQDMRKLIGR